MDEKLLNYFNRDELAATVWKSKYAAEGEETPDCMHKRMAKEFARIEEGYKSNEEYCLEFQKGGKAKLLSEYGKTRKYITENSIYNLFKDFKYIVPQGSIMSTLGTKTIASLSNCYTISSPEDSYGGILKTDEELVQLMKRRAGVGTNLNTLRPAGAKVNNVAKTSTGADSFMDRYSNTTREVAQGGRRGALMLLLSCEHPSVFEFVKKKKDRTKVTGANVSVMFTDKFMEAVKKDEDFICHFPLGHPYGNDEFSSIRCKEYNKLYWGGKVEIDGTGKLPLGDYYIMKIKAKELWDLVIEMAWENAEPGIAFIDKVNSYSPDGVYFKIDKCNPCGN